MAKENQACKSGPGGPATGIVGPIAVEPGHATSDALPEADQTATLHNRVVHLVHIAVAQHHVGAAIAARNVVGLPGPERGFVDRAIGLDLQPGIPKGALFFLELRGDGPERGFARLDPSVIFGPEQPEIQLPRIGRLRRLAKGQQAEQDAQHSTEAGFFQGSEAFAHGNSASRTKARDGAAKPAQGQVQRGNTLPISPRLTTGCSFHDAGCALRYRQAEMESAMRMNWVAGLVAISGVL